MRLLLVFVVVSAFNIHGDAQDKSRVRQWIESSNSAVSNLESIQSFRIHSSGGGEFSAFDKNVSKKIKHYQILQQKNLEEILGQKNKPLSLSIPLNQQSTKEIIVVPHRITTNDFSIETSDGKIIRDVPAVSNQFIGYVKNENKSIVALSINPDGIKGFFSGGGHNYFLQQTDQIPKGFTVLYDQADMNSPDLNCVSSDNDFKTGIQTLQRELPQNLEIGCKTVRMYIECDYRLYLRMNSDINRVAAFVLGVFNCTATLLKNEGINIQVSGIYISTTPDEYFNANTITSFLNVFSKHINLKKPSNADIGFAVTNTNIGGGGASGNLMGCQYFPRAACGLIDEIGNFPEFSHSVYTFAHETGHLLGSPHSHSCTWPGGPIDNCWTPEGGCAPGPDPVNGGTIMSYCIKVGFNLANGYGPLPSALMRSVIDTAACLESCGNSICENMQINEVEATINDSLLLFTWKQEAIQYRIGYKSNASREWTYVNAVNTDSFILRKTRCEEFYEFSIAAYCDAENRFSTSHVFNIGNSQANVFRYRLNQIVQRSTFATCPGRQFLHELSASDTIGFTYTWYKNGEILPGLTTRKIWSSDTGSFTAVAQRNGCRFESDVTNIVYSNITSGFSLTMDKNNVSFFSTSGCGKKYEWDFGDGTSDTLQHPFHQYERNGKFNACVLVTDSIGRTSKTCRPILIYDELTDSLNFSTIGLSYGPKFREEACQQVLSFGDDVAGYLYYSDGQSVNYNLPRNGTIELKIYPGLPHTVTDEGTPNQQIAVTDTGYIMNYNFLDPHLFTLFYTRWGGISFGIDSTFIGNASAGITGPLRLNEWNTIGLSYGQKGMEIIVNGKHFAATSKPVKDSMLTNSLRLQLGAFYHYVNNHQANDKFTGLVDKVRFSFKETDYSFSAFPASQGRDTVYVNKSVCHGGSYDGHYESGTFYKNNITANGCDSVTVLRLSIGETIKAGDTIRYHGDGTGDIFLHQVDGGFPPYQYSWSTGDSLQNLQNASPGNYNLTITDEAGCNAQFNFRLFKLKANEDWISIIPNPAKEGSGAILRIGTLIGGNYSLMIYDVAGRRYSSGQRILPAGVSDWQLPSLRKGMYFLHLIDARGKKTTRQLMYY